MSQDANGRLLGQSFATLAIRAVGAGLNFGVNVFLARVLGARGTGIYYLSVTTMTLAVITSRLGLDNVVLRLTATSAGNEDWTEVERLKRRAFALSAVVGGLATLAVSAAAPFIASSIFKNSALASPLRIMSLATIPFSLLILQAQLLQGTGRVKQAMVIRSVGMPAVQLAVLPIAVTLAGVRGASGSLVVAAVVVYGCGVLLWKKTPGTMDRRRAPLDLRAYSSLLEASVPLLIVAGLNFVLEWTDMLMLGIWKSSAVVGTYGIAAKTALLTSLILVAVSAVVAPRFAQLYASGRRRALEALAGRAAVLSAALALPLGILLVCAPSLVLSLFGSSFQGASSALRVLAVGQFVNASVGCVGYLLMMSGHERTMRNVVVMAATTNVALNVLLVPRWGPVGAATATSLALALQNGLALLAVRRHLRIRVWAHAFQWIR